MPDRDPRVFYCASEEDARRVIEQLSDAEVPGFQIRTTIDDIIGKLYALRQQMRVEIPDDLAGIIDDVDELVEKAIDLAFDPDAEEIDRPESDGDITSLAGSWPNVGPGPAVIYRSARPDGTPVDRTWASGLYVTGSGCVGMCSCGTPTISRYDPDPAD